MSRVYAPFRFREFVVRQQTNAMKVGTDGVLLGLLARAPHPSSRILDIGSGTSLITLMLAQRYPTAHLLGIEIDGDSAAEGAENARASAFGERIEILHGDFRTYVFSRRFDLIVTNPPYYPAEHRTPDRRRSTARHAHDLPPCDLFRSARSLLTSVGVLTLILPLSCHTDYLQAAEAEGFFPGEIVYVCTHPRKAPRRVVLTLRQCPSQSIAIDYLSIYREDYTYTQEYTERLRPFVLEQYLRRKPQTIR